MISAGICFSYKREILKGVHSDKDNYRIALYDESADLSPETEKYTSKGEISANGYEKGGKTLEGFRVEISDNKSVIVMCDNPIWKIASIAAWGALIYNASQSNRAVSVIKFVDGKAVSTNAKFEVQIPFIAKLG